MFHFLGGIYGGPIRPSGAKDTLELLFGGGGGIGEKVNGFGQVQIRQKERGTYVTGISGSGKSTVNLNQIQEDIRQGEEAIIVIDPHHDLAEQVLLRVPAEHAHRVILFDPLAQRERPFGLNPFQWGSEMEYQRKAEAVVDVFAFSWYGTLRNTPTLQSTLTTLVRTLFEGYAQYRCHFGHLQMLLREDKVGESWRKRLSALVQGDLALESKWADWTSVRQRKTDTESTRNKVNFVISNPVIRNVLCQTETSPAFDLQRVFSEKQVLVISLFGLGPEGQRLLGGIILAQILTAAFLRAEQAARTPVHLYVDEFHLFPANIFVDIINQARKYGLYVTLTNQNLTQIDREARAAALSCGNLIAFQTTPADARILEPHFHRDMDFPEGGLHRLEQFQALAKLAEGTSSQQAWINTYPEQGEENLRVHDSIVARSLSYGRPRDQVEAEIRSLTERASTAPSKQRRRSSPSPASKSKPADRRTVRFWDH